MKTNQPPPLPSSSFSSPNTADTSAKVASEGRAPLEIEAIEKKTAPVVMPSWTLLDHRIYLVAPILIVVGVFIKPFHACLLKTFLFGGLLQIWVVRQTVSRARNKDYGMQYFWENEALSCLFTLLAFIVNLVGAMLLGVSSASS